MSLGIETYPDDADNEAKEPVQVLEPECQGVTLVFHIPRHHADHQEECCKGKHHPRKSCTLSGAAASTCTLQTAGNISMVKCHQAQWHKGCGRSSDTIHNSNSAQPSICSDLCRMLPGRPGVI
eukprot:CAMPEP_0178445960 /NCGR_PEP_ID=MMETSP0689_2-20121128/40499_1 /TAXON_ID=160604 /ORGANISM="Amphidinium massartii, Strain CS-259" /LENGTH=122 /DNA_ID=CAMNT_0020070653 /DNA_START=109 /DNA_END=477 /DNA_ORIENTATION=-